MVSDRVPRYAWPALVAAAWLGHVALFWSSAPGLEQFSWMDPEGYYADALALLRGQTSPGQFLVPTLWPLAGVAAMAVLWPDRVAAASVNLIFVGLLGAGLYGLGRRLAAGRAAAAVAAGAVLALPVVLGLAREFYSELAVASLVVAGLWCWACSDNARRPVWTAALALVWTAGLLVKMTYPVYFVLPAVVWLAASPQPPWERLRRAGRLAGAAGLALGVYGLYLVLCPAGRDYVWTRLDPNNTRLPLLELIGPRQVWTWQGLTYYWEQTATSLLGVLILAAPAAGAALRSGSPAALGRWTLLASFLGAVAIFTLDNAKEPRHLVPAVPGLVLLIVMGLERWRGGPVWLGLFASAAILQGALALGPGARSWPYLNTVHLPAAELARLLLKDRRPVDHPALPGQLAYAPAWYDTVLVLEDFPANLALAAAWMAYPALVFRAGPDLPRSEDAEYPYRRFYEPVAYTALSLYNWRCGWDHDWRLFPDEEIYASADFVLRFRAGADRGGDPAEGGEPAGYRPIGCVAVRPRGWIDVWGHSPRPPQPRRSLRLRYIERFLAGVDPWAGADPWHQAHLAHYGRLVAAALCGGRADQTAARQAFEEFFEESERRGLIGSGLEGHPADAVFTDTVLRALHRFVISRRADAF